MNGRYLEFRCLPLVVALVATVLSVTCPLQAQGQATRFINLTIPAPWSNLRPTWLLTATADRAIVAQDSHFAGKDDIRVIEIVGDRYHFVGENGRGITGVEGSILHAAAKSPDGRLWIMAEHSRMLNQIQGNQFCLYVLENDRWNPIGRRFGAPTEHSWSHHEHGLHFLGDNRPVTVSIHATLNGENSTWRKRLRRLEADRWVNVPGHEYVSDRHSHVRFLWRADDAWLIHVRDRAGQTTLDARWLKGPRPEDVVGPFRLDSWAGAMTFFHFSVAPDGSIAVVGRKGQIGDNQPDAPLFVKLYRPDDKLVFKPFEAPFPTAAGDHIALMKWSPTGTLHVVGTTTEKISVHQFKGGQWDRVGEAGQPREFETTIMDAKLFFRDDGRPIVTWEKFTTVD